MKKRAMQMSNSKRFLPRLRRYMDEGDRRQHRLGTLLYALSGVMCGIGLAIMMPATMALQSGDPQWGLTFWGWAVALAAVTVVGSTASFFGTKLSYAAGLGFMRNMQVVIGNKVSRLPLGWFKADSAGRLSRMVTQEMISTGQAAALYVGQLIKNAAAAIVFCAAVWLWSWQIGIMLTLSIPILFLLLRVSQACVGKGNGLEDSAERDIAARIVEFARCQGALRACRAGADYEELESSFVEGRKRSIRGLWWSALGEILSGTSVQMLVVSMIIAVSYLGASGSIGALETVVMIGVALRFTTLLNEIASALFGMEDRRAMLDGMDEVVEAAELPVVGESRARPTDASVRMGEVRFSYMKEKPILRGVDLDVPEGSMVAIVGPSGCGKTTMLKLIARFYDVDDGAVRIGGVDVRDMTTEDLFARVSFVFQDVYLFNDTLRNNVLMANPDASEEQLRAVADLAGVTEVVERLPGGWETLCGEGGRSLSGGERQRVSIARALLKQAPIVLLDEATSALDAENEKNVVRSIETLKRRSTLIVVAHKLETVRMADKIVVMDSSGKVAETGTHNELIALEGEYKDFWDKRNASSPVAIGLANRAKGGSHETEGHRDNSGTGSDRICPRDGRRHDNRHVRRAFHVRLGGICGLLRRSRLHHHGAQGAKTGDGLLLLVDLRRALRDHGLCRRDAPVPDRGHRRRDHRRRLRKQEEGVAVVFGIDVHLLDAHDSVRARSGIRWAGDFRREHLA